MNIVVIEHFDVSAIGNDLAWYTRNIKEHILFKGYPVEHTLFDYHVDVLKRYVKDLLEETIEEYNITLVVGDKIRVDDYNFIISDLYFTSNVLYYSVKALNKWR